MAKKIKSRTYGWVQNPSDFNKLKKVVQIFDSESAQYSMLRDELIDKFIPNLQIKSALKEKFNKGIEVFSYSELVGGMTDSNGKSVDGRKGAVADGIIQLTVPSQGVDTQGKVWTDNWTADGYLRWALSLNFVKHDRFTDQCRITDFGLKFARCCSEEEEIEILRKALLSYPPASRVLEILSEQKGNSVTKFYIGDRLGFKGEPGFTSYDDSMMREWILGCNSSKEIAKIKSNVEGTGDKYARMICSWLRKVDFVTRVNGPLILGVGCSGFPEYKITAQGEHALRKAKGSSCNKKITKYLTWEFLATKDGAEARDYVRSRRANLLKTLNKSNDIEGLSQELKKHGFNDAESVLEKDLEGLINCGINITKNNNLYVLKDYIVDFSIPDSTSSFEKATSSSINIKNELLDNTNLQAKYYEMVDIAYDGRRSRDLELMTVDLLRNVCGFQAKVLGGGRKPDGIASYGNHGLIIDTKAYKQGYGKNIGQEDEMVRYIEDNQQRDSSRNCNEWWSSFDEKVDTFYFLWVSSEFVGHFEEQLIETSKRTHAKGAAIDIRQLLYIADAIMKNEMNLEDFVNLIDNKVIEKF